MARHGGAGMDDSGMVDEADRRPIAARDLGATRRVAAWLVARGASPNGISVAGMVAGIGAGGAFAAVPCWPGAAWALWLLGALLVQARLMANLLDGMVAIGRGVASPVGELFNEVPDRVSDTAVLVGLGVAAGWLSLGLAAALAAMLTAYVRTTARAAGAPSDFGGPMAKQHRMALVTALAAWCAVVPGAAGGSWAVRAVLAVIALGSLATAWRRLARAAAALEARR
jgi:phosphatidylglycerophosphate synthase